MLRIIAKYFTMFMFYSFIGWLWESVFCSWWGKGRLINRGFLNGPYCTVYGYGAILVIALPGRIEDTVLLFTVSAFLTCGLEYVTSAVMERMFNARWWDYSNMRFNIKGRVCLIGFLLFGAFSTLLVKVLNPAVSGVLDRIDPLILNASAAFLFGLFIIDNWVTFKGFGGFNSRLCEFTEMFDSSLKDEGTAAKSDTVGLNVKNGYEQLADRLTSQQRRMLKAFPELNPLKYSGTVKRLRIMVAKVSHGKRQ